ncbi:MAG: GNAT family N-acetyltransferase [Alphaproteobacteria bacterium]|nr:GNAT family N-acetyltransferase [Alphaproteobacteria bacterium]MCB9691925.1 GNAT family N-acetyltransferase [Alphaproteobacteria bacterium]
MVHSAPRTITPEALDDYLARGWFRFGGTMRTTRFTVWEERDLRTTLWTRTRLDDFQWSKSNRRLLSRTRRAFRVVEQPARLDAAHEALYARYIRHVGGERPSTLIDFLGGEDLHACFATRELALYDGERLVAFSYFDQGRTSLMSLLGVFDPDLERASLGYATLALEVEHGLQHGLEHHYSGYVLPGEPRMDYKTRIGGMQFLHPDAMDWQDWEHLDHDLLPDRRTLNALDRVGRALTRYGVPARRLLNPLFEIADSPAITERMVDQPVFLMVGRGGAPIPMVTWDDEARRYDLWMGVPAVIRHRRSEEGPEKTTGTALIHQEHGRFGLAADVVQAVLKLVR